MNSRAAASTQTLDVSHAYEDRALCHHTPLYELARTLEVDNDPWVVWVKEQLKSSESRPASIIPESS